MTAVGADRRRRRIVVVATLLVGAALLGTSLATRPGSAWFAPLLLAVALTWTAGGFASGRLHLGYLPFRGTLRRPVLTPILVGVAAGAVFLAGGALLRLVPPLRDLAVHVLDHAQHGMPWLVALLALANGAAEEVFFRGAVYAAIGEPHAVAGSTAVYVAVTAATGNPLLVLAGVLMGSLFALQRRSSGGILAPLLTHLTWSLVMLAALPAVVGT